MRNQGHYTLKTNSFCILHIIIFSDRFMLKKTSSQSSIPRPLPTTTSSKRMMDNNATANSSSMLRQPIGINKVQSSSGQNSKSSSPQKRIHQISKKLPPPLAPKPSLANITKVNASRNEHYLIFMVFFWKIFTLSYQRFLCFLPLKNRFLRFFFNGKWS